MSEQIPFPSEPERRGDVNLDLQDLLERHGTEPTPELIDDLADNRERYMKEELLLIMEKNTREDLTISFGGVLDDVLALVEEKDED